MTTAIASPVTECAEAVRSEGLQVLRGAPW